MDVRRLRVGEWISAAAGAALLVVLFLPWFHAGEIDASGWEAFSVTDLLVALGALSGIVLAVLAAGQRQTAVPTGTTVIAIALMLIVLLVTLYRVFINQPGPDAVIDLSIGAYLAVLLQVTLFYGIFRAMADESAAHLPENLPDPQPAPPATAA